MADKKVRVLQWIVKPVVVVDDGENLEVLPTKEQAIPANLWEAFKAEGADIAIEALQAEVDKQ